MVPVQPANRLSVVFVTESRPHALDYQAYSSLLVSRAVQASTAAGWAVDLVAAGDLGTAETLRRTDGSTALVVLGGEDIAPEFYGAARGYRAEGAHVEAADEAQIALVQRAAGRGTPVLGICRGHQIIDVALGGTLVQDLGETHDHRNDGVPITSVMSDHSVAISAGSRILGRFAPSLLTRSAHHQAVDVLGAGLQVAAHAHDGLVEAIEHESLPLLGVQWHPEDPGAVRGQFAALLGAVTDAAGVSAAGQSVGAVRSRSAAVAA